MNKKPFTPVEEQKNNSDQKERYVLKEMIGKGCFSVVYSCIDAIHPNKPLIMKKIIKDNASAEIEREILNKIKHLNWS